MQELLCSPSRLLCVEGRNEDFCIPLIKDWSNHHVVPLPVSNRPWSHIWIEFHHGPTIFGFPYLYPHHCRPLLQSMRVDSTKAITHHLRNSQNPLPTNLLSLWDSSPVILFSGCPQSNGQIEQKIQDIPAVILSWSSKQLEPFPSLDWVCIELPVSSHHRINTLPLRTLLPTAPVSLVRGAFQHSSCPLLVLREQEDLGLISHLPAEGSLQTQEADQC